MTLWESYTYIGNACDTLALELAVVELLHRGSQIGGGLKFNEALAC